MGTMHYKVVPNEGRIKLDFERPRQMERYRINGRNSSENTIKKLKGEEFMGCSVISGAIDRITDDYNKKYLSEFPDDYYVFCGKLMTVLAISRFRSMSKMLPSYIIKWTALDYVSEIIDGEKGFKDGIGTPLFHIYENVVRRNDNTGIDKLMHFLYSAKWAYVASPGISQTLGYAKEFFLDEVNSWFNDDIGWDDEDILANERGIEFGKKLAENNNK